MQKNRPVEKRSPPAILFFSIHTLSQLNSFIGDRGRPGGHPADKDSISAFGLPMLAWWPPRPSPPSSFAFLSQNSIKSKQSLNIQMGAAALKRRCPNHENCSSAAKLVIAAGPGAHAPPLRDSTTVVRSCLDDGEHTRLNFITACDEWHSAN